MKKIYALSNACAMLAVAALTFFGLRTLTHTTHSITELIACTVAAAVLSLLSVIFESAAKGYARSKERGRIKRKLSEQTRRLAEDRLESRLAVNRMRMNINV